MMPDPVVVDPSFVPPVGESHQLIYPEITDALRIAEEPMQMTGGLALSEVGDGRGFTVNVTNTRDELPQLLLNDSA